MKNNALIKNAALLALSILPLSGSSFALQITPPEEDAARHIDGIVEQAIDELEELARQRNATRSDFERVRNVLLERGQNASEILQEGAVTRTRFLRSLDELDSRARQSYLAELDSKEVHDHFVRVLHSRAQDSLLQQARERGVSRTIYERASRDLDERAQAAIGSEPDPALFFQRMQRARNELRARAMETLGSQGEQL